jgi:hypothetical protein
LRRHHERKTPCAPIIDSSEIRADQKKAYSCRYCGRQFSTPQAQSRHIRQNCKIANTDDGMDKLMERTLQKQMLEQRAMLEKQQEQITRLTTLLEGQLSISGPPAITTNNINNIHNGPVTHLTQVNTVVNIKSFDSEDRIYIPISLVKAAFTENPRLIEYCQLSDDERVDAERAAPYVLEALIDLVRRAHKDPVYRNVHLNPRRADQVMVCVGEDQRWEVRPLIDVIRALFDGVADNLHRLIITDRERSQLPFDVQSAASWVPNLYEDEPDRFVKDGKAPMAAHLANTAPGRTLETK